MWCNAWPQDIMETKIINRFKSWWGKFAEDRAISFCSKWCSGWNLQLRSHYVTGDQKLGGRGGSLSVCIMPICFTWVFWFCPQRGWRARWFFAFPCNVSMTVLLCFSIIKIYTEVFIYFNLYAFPHPPSPRHAGDINISVNLSLTALQNGREAAQSPFTRGSSPWQESAGQGRSLRGRQLPSPSLHSVWCSGEMTM